MFRIENPTTGKTDDLTSFDDAMSKAMKRAVKECGSVAVYSISKDPADIVRYEDTSAIWSSDWKPCPTKRRRR